MQIAFVGMGIPRSEFWRYTFKEFWPLYNYKYGKSVSRGLTRDEFNEMKNWQAGKKWRPSKN
jgi:hypothetical protein